jgi:hypothetical protein
MEGIDFFGMGLADFRRQLLSAIHEAKARQPDSHVHLLYAPELADPLELANDERRDTAMLRHPLEAPEGLQESQPRIVSLDCRRVASYFLETDPGIDDPLLESSITQAHAECFLGEHAQRVLTNDLPGLSEGTVCGWIISRETASALAARINACSNQFDAQHGRRWIRWHDPACITGLWPGLSDDQRRALLGDGVWLALDVAGRVQRFAADPSAGAPAQHGMRRLDISQSKIADNLLVVADLARKWQSLCAADGKSLPPHADAQLHHHVQAAQAHRLDAEDLAAYVLLAVQLHEGATESPELLHVLRQARERGIKLRDVIAKLPDRYWQRHLHSTNTSMVAAAGV